LNVTDSADSYIAGQLGIAVPSPAYALDVNGRVHSKGTIITETTGNDQVGFACELLSAGGTGRAAINCTGTAQSFFGGFVHIAAGRGLGIGSTIGTALSFSLHLFAGQTAGKPGGGEWSDSSTRRMKKDIRDIPDALETLLTLRGRNFEWDDAEHKAALPGKQWGFVAEEVEETPLGRLWVSEDFTGRKALTIRGFNALAVEAIRVLEQRLTALEAAAR
jgi:hypothetical protein